MISHRRVPRARASLRAVCGGGYRMTDIYSRTKVAKNRTNVRNPLGKIKYPLGLIFSVGARIYIQNKYIFDQDVIFRNFI